MASLLKRFVSLLTGGSPAKYYRPLKNVTRRDVLQMSSEQGRDIFGPVPKNGRREFFCLDDHTWIWHEEWVDEQGKKQSRTTRYEVHDKSILKVQEGTSYQYLEGEELRNFAVAVRIYYERVMKNIFGRDPVTGQPITASPDTIGVDAR